MAGRRKVVSVDLTGDKQTTLAKWYEISKRVSQEKVDEQALRQKVVLDNFTADKYEGSETIEIGSGWRLKATKTQNISATNTSQQTTEMLNAIGPLNPELAIGLVSWKPEISTTAYRELLVFMEAHPELKPLVAAAITIKPGMPELEIIPPKEGEAA